MGQARITGSLLWTCSGIQSIAIGGIVLLLGKTFVKLQKLVGYISAGLNYHQSLESGKLVRLVTC